MNIATEQIFLPSSSSAQGLQKSANTTSLVNLENVEDFSNVCRVCAAVTELVMPIFSGEGLHNNLADKIHKHLQIKVSERDSPSLPVVACYQCVSTLLATHELVQCSIQADAALRTRSAVLAARRAAQQEKLLKNEGDESEETDRCSFCGERPGAGLMREHLANLHADQLFHCGDCDRYISRRVFFSHMTDHAKQYEAETAQAESDLQSLLWSGPAESNSGDRNKINRSEDSVTKRAGNASEGNPASDVSWEPESTEKSVKKLDAIEPFPTNRKPENASEGHPTSNVSWELESTEKSVKKAIVVINREPFLTNQKPENACEGNPTSNVSWELESTQNSAKQAIVVINREPFVTNQKPESALDANRKPKPALEIDRGLKSAFKQSGDGRVSETHSVPMKDQDSESRCLKSFKNGREIETSAEAHGEPDDFSDQSDSESGFAPLPDSVFTAIEDSQDARPTSNGKADKKQPRTCPQCGKIYTAASSYFYHMKHSHGSEKEHGCDTCGARFSTRGALREHETVHSGERKLQCTRCGKRFRAKASLYIHQQTHGAAKKWSCEKCGKAFRWRAQLKRHATRHAGARAHVCASCPRAFSVRADLLRHARTHGRARLACPVAPCAATFAQPRYLRAHLTRKHPGEPRDIAIRTAGD